MNSTSSSDMAILAKIYLNNLVLMITRRVYQLRLFTYAQTFVTFSPIPLPPPKKKPIRPIVFYEESKVESKSWTAEHPEGISSTPEILRVKEVIEHNELNGTFQLTQNQELLDKLIENGIQYQQKTTNFLRVEDLLIQTSPNKIIHQMVKVYLALRLFESARLTDYVLQGVIVNYLVKLIVKAKLVMQYDQFVDEVNALSDEDTKKIFDTGQSFEPQTLRLHIQLQVLNSFIHIFQRKLMRPSYTINAEESEQIEMLFDLVFEASAYLPFDWRISFAYLKMITHYASKGGTEFKEVIFKHQSVVMICVDTLITHIPKLQPNQLILLMYVVSRLEVSQANLRVNIQFWTNFLESIAASLPYLTINELKSLWKSLHKAGVLTPAIEKFISEKLGEATTNIQNLDEDYFIGLLQLVCNLGLFQGETVALNFIDSIFENRIKDDAKISGTRIATFFYFLINRFGIRDEKYWHFFCNNYQFFYQAKVGMFTQFIMELQSNQFRFSDDIQHELQRVFQDPKIQHLIETHMSTMLSKSKDSSKTFMFENNIEKFFKARGLRYEKGYQIKQNLVDFYFPDLNMIVEIMGTIHFVFRQYDPNLNLKKYNFVLENQTLEFSIDYNTRTKLKLEMLKNLGFNVKTIDFYDSQELSYRELVENLLN